MFVVLAGTELTLGTEATTAPAPPVPCDDLFLSPAFVQKLAAELWTDTVFGPIMWGAQRHWASWWTDCNAIVDTSSTSKDCMFLVLCCPCTVEVRGRLPG